MKKNEVKELIKTLTIYMNMHRNITKKKNNLNMTFSK